MQTSEPILSSSRESTSKSGHKLAWLVLSGLILLYLFISLRHLATLPRVYEDEPWQASVAWKLATRGILGSDMLTGFYGMERHYYAFMPLNPILTAPVLRMGGLGLFQARLVSVLQGMLILLLTYGLGSRLFNAKVGLLAIVFLLLVRTTTTSLYNLTGIPLLDIVRIHRYDPGAVVFGLAALHIYLSARQKNSWGWYLFAGLLAGLSSLVHLYGAFWLATILLLAVIERVSFKPLLVILFGFSLPWVPYILYVLADIPDWRGQTQFYAERFELLNPAWYWRNLIREYGRYNLGLLPLRRDALLRLGTWAFLIAVPISLFGLGWQAFRKKDQPARCLFIPAALIPALFALLISVKFSNYLIAILPLLALATAWGCIRLWQAVRARNYLRIILLILLAAILVEGSLRIAALQAAAGNSTPYADYIARVHAEIPPGARVLGLQSFWIGLHDLDYRTWLVPLYQAHDIYQPLPIEETLARLDPQVILIDPAMRSYFSKPPAGDDLPERILSWMYRAGFRLTASVEDATYGVMEVYVREHDND